MERSCRTRRDLGGRPFRASAPTEAIGRPIQTPIGRTSVRSGSVQQQGIRSEGGPRANLKQVLPPPPDRIHCFTLGHITRIHFARNHNHARVSRFPSSSSRKSLRRCLRRKARYCHSRFDGSSRLAPTSSRPGALLRSDQRGRNGWNRWFQDFYWRAHFWNHSETANGTAWRVRCSPCDTRAFPVRA